MSTGRTVLRRSRAAVGSPGRGVMLQMEGAGCCPAHPAWARCILPASRGPIASRLHQPLCFPGRKEVGGSLWSPRLGWLGALPSHRSALGVLLRPFAAGKGPGGAQAPAAAELGLLGAMGRGDLCLCVCVCVCVHIPCSPGAMVPLPCTHLPAWGHL